MSGAGGRAWRFGDDIDTDVLAPGIYMKKPIAELAQHCLEAIDPRFAKEVHPGDIVVAGRNFGMGSSREQAAQALIALGVAAVLAKSFAGIFYRNALNQGLLALICADTDRIAAGDRLVVDGVKGEVVNCRSGERLACEPLPPHLVEMVADGGLVAHLEKKLARNRAGT
ncbi:MAG TPA: 3-isopropylmalate dehydratase [Alphaproteobacteria bacterium]|jgi:3-isopropylmalate/(R)-2-methylmalate dehydratase small subunit